MISPITIIQLRKVIYITSEYESPFSLIRKRDKGAIWSGRAPINVFRLSADFEISPMNEQRSFNVSNLLPSWDLFLRFTLYRRKKCEINEHLLRDWKIFPFKFPLPLNFKHHLARREQLYQEFSRICNGTNLVLLGRCLYNIQAETSYR